MSDRLLWGTVYIALGIMNEGVARRENADSVLQGLVTRYDRPRRTIDSIVRSLSLA